MIDQEFHGGRDNEVAPPLPETARTEDDSPMPREEAPREEESAFSARALREAEAEKAQREQRRRRTRPLVQLTAAAMAVVVTGGVAMQSHPIPEPVAEIVEVIETPEPLPEPVAEIVDQLTEIVGAAVSTPEPSPEATLEAPAEVLAWLEQLSALFAGGADDDALEAGLRSDAARSSLAWIEENSAVGVSYANGSVFDSLETADYPALRLEPGSEESLASYASASGTGCGICLTEMFRTSFRGTIDGDTANGTLMALTVTSPGLLIRLSGSFLQTDSDYYLEDGSVQLSEPFDQPPITFFGTVREGILSADPGYNAEIMTNEEYCRRVGASQLPFSGTVLVLSEGTLEDLKHFIILFDSLYHIPDTCGVDLESFRF